MSQEQHSALAGFVLGGCFLGLGFGFYLGSPSIGVIIASSVLMCGCLIAFVAHSLSGS
jgi:hypothetical protein